MTEPTPAANRTLADLTWPEVRARPWPVVLLPWGATEPHNTHLPYGTDTLLGSTVANRVASRCAELGVDVLALPPVPFGVNTTQLDLPMVINVMPSTQRALLADVLASVAPHGVRALVLLNAHGGNELRALVRELQPSTSVMLVIVNWWQVGDARVFDDAGDHAGELETSAVLHVAPHLVAPRDTWGDGAAKASVLAGVRDGWAWLPRRWTQVTADTGVGDPRAASAEKGAVFLSQAVERLAGLCAELAVVAPERLYE